MALTLKRPDIRLPVWGWVVVAAVVLGIAAAVYWWMPRKGSYQYAACRVFLTQYVRFPKTVKIREVNEGEGRATLWFSDINPFGSEQMRTMECFYATTPQGIRLTRITVDRRSLPDAQVSAMAATLPQILASKPDATLPDRLPDDFNDLKD